MNTEETVTITKEKYNELLEDSKLLTCLICAGVDNWYGYDYAVEDFRTSMEFGDE